jgi:hypothetical protein
MSDDRDTDPLRVKTGAKDPLRVAGRMTLHDGELFAGSGSVAGSDGGLVLGAAVDTPTGRQVHIGSPIHEDNKKEWRGRRVRTPQEQARLDELEASPRGAVGADHRETDKLRGQYLSMLRVHHSAKSELAEARAAQAAMEATAQSLDAATAAELERVTAELDAASTRYEEMAGWTTASAEIPARNGGALVFEAL